MKRYVLVFLTIVAFEQVLEASESLCGEAKHRLEELKLSIEEFHSKYNRYPLRLEEIVNPGRPGDSEKDPWGQPYVYRPTPDGYRLLSKGSDLLEGTEDDVVLGEPMLGCRSVPKSCCSCSDLWAD